MYGQFFGSYLLNKRAVTPQQLNTAITDIAKSHIKLGTLAMYKGYMTSEEVDEVCYLQRREDKHFGEIAVERSYLFEDQLVDLLESQIPEYLRLGQTLVDSGVLTNAQLHDLMVSYSEEHYTDTSFEDEELDNTQRISRSRSLVENFFKSAGIDVDEHTITYMNLIFNNFVRFIGDDFTPLEPVLIDDHQTSYCIYQGIKGSSEISTRIDMDRDVAISFASRYAEMEFDEFDDYVAASIEDFLNLHNGLFCVNLSNVLSLNYSLTATEREEEEDIQLPEGTLAIPIIYPFGTIYVIYSPTEN